MSFPAKLALLLVSALVSSSAHAQRIVSARAGLINYLQGAVALDDQRIRTGTQLRHVQPGQLLSTARGRVEVLLAPGIAMRLAEDTAIRIQDARLEDTQVTLEKGFAYIEVVKLEKDSRLRVFLRNNGIELKHTGLYRFEFSPARLRVLGGEVGFLRAGVPLLAKRGQTVDLNTFELSESEATPPDPFHNWSAQRSFALFNATEDTRRKQNHWRYIGDGWVWNDNYKVKFRSPQARRENSWAEDQLRRRNPSVPRAESQQ